MLRVPRDQNSLMHAVAPVTTNSQEYSPEVCVAKFMPHKEHPIAYSKQLHYITLHYITLHYITLHYITLHYITLHYITLHSLHYITLHYITLHYITLHYITLHYSFYILHITH